MNIIENSAVTNEELMNKLNQINIKKDKLMYLLIKKILDIFICALGCIILSPLFIIIAISIKLDSKGPVIYSQYRVGKGGKIFKMYKFRSMVVNAESEKSEIIDQNEKDGPIFKMVDDPRVTRVGRFLRRNSLDEFPQIINIFRGEMSIVGPRPPLIEEVMNYTTNELQRLCVDQGLTCYWQIRGRSNTTFKEWMKMDMEYIEERNSWVDIKIIILTVPAVILRKGAY